MDAPLLPPAVAGRSALPTFLAVEAWARARTADAERDAAERLEEAVVEAQRIRTEGEAALQQAVVESEREAMREVESRARDRISDTRRAVEAWVQQSEEAAAAAVPAALGLLCGDDAGQEPAPRMEP